MLLRKIAPGTIPAGHHGSRDSPPCHGRQVQNLPEVHRVFTSRHGNVQTGGNKEKGNEEGTVMWWVPKFPFSSLCCWNEAAGRTWEMIFLSLPLLSQQAQKKDLSREEGMRNLVRCLLSTRFRLPSPVFRVRLWPSAGKSVWGSTSVGVWGWGGSQLAADVASVQARKKSGSCLVVIS